MKMKKNVINVANLINKNTLSFYNIIYDFYEITHDKLLDYELIDEKRIFPSNDTLINTYTLEEVYKKILENLHFMFVNIIYNIILLIINILKNL